nr:collagen alpha-1(I) chain-like [Macaca fascicularis]
MPKGLHPPALSSDPRGTARQAGQPESCSPRNERGTRGAQAARGPRAPGHHLLPERRRGPPSGDDAASAAHTCRSPPGNPRPPPARRTPTQPPGAGALGRARPGAGRRGAPLRGLRSAAAAGEPRGEASPPSSPTPLQTASPVPCPGASRARAAAAPSRERAAGIYRLLVIRAGPRAGAGQCRPVRCSREPGKPRVPGRLEVQSRRLQLPPRPSRPPGLRARVTAERLLKGAAAARAPAPAPAPGGSNPGQSGRGPEAGRGADLLVLELGSGKEPKNPNTRSRSVEILEAHTLPRAEGAVPGFSKASHKTCQWGNCESPPPQRSVPGLAT